MAPATLSYANGLLLASPRVLAATLAAQSAGPLALARGLLGEFQSSLKEKSG